MHFPRTLFKLRSTLLHRLAVKYVYVTLGARKVHPELRISLRLLETRQPSLVQLSTKFQLNVSIFEARVGKPSNFTSVIEAKY